MATGDIVWFNAALGLDYFAGWATSDDIKVAICDNTVAPTLTTATPALGDFTEVSAAGTYTAGGTSLGTWTAVWNDPTAGGTATLDSATNPTWAQDASNDTDATWGIIYNDTQAGDPAFAYVELGTADMSAGDLTITWNASGIADIQHT
jgi:hypothetical protein